MPLPEDDRFSEAFELDCLESSLASVFRFDDSFGSGFVFLPDFRSVAVNSFMNLTANPQERPQALDRYAS